MIGKIDLSDDDVDDRITQDRNGTMRVPLMLCDQDATATRRVSDALKRYNRFAAHRPGPVVDALQGAGLRTSRSLEKRRGVTLQDAIAMRDAAFADTYTRAQETVAGNLSNNVTPTDPDAEHDDAIVMARAEQARDDALEARRIAGDNAWRRSANEQRAYKAYYQAATGGNR